MTQISISITVMDLIEDLIRIRIITDISLIPVATIITITQPAAVEEGRLLV